MIYEFIATITAGFGMAGIALIIRHLSKLAGKSTPKWLIPVCAGLGMLIFQIYQEYHWSEQQINRLPEDITIIKVINGQSWYRPWSYVKPQVVRFMAISQSIEATNQDMLDQGATNADNIRVVDIYLFERRMSTKVIRQTINCSKEVYAVISYNSSISVPAIANKDITWQSIDPNDDVFTAVCH